MPSEEEGAVMLGGGRRLLGVLATCIEAMDEVVRQREVVCDKT